MGVNIFLSSWNQHLPTPEEAVQMYENAGGSITDPGCFGIDPLAQHPDKSRIRETSFSDRYPSISDIFHDVVNGNSARFKQAWFSVLILLRDFHPLSSLLYIIDNKNFRTNA